MPSHFENQTRERLEGLERHIQLLLKERRLESQQKHGERVEARQKQNIPAGTSFDTYKGPY